MNLSVKDYHPQLSVPSVRESFPQAFFLEKSLSFFWKILGASLLKFSKFCYELSYYLLTGHLKWL
ncbi:hypothetical protein [Neochlamydia sp. S13]|uniref:hypothetical protein n=1 Tax=Neochlamydia sp. S13 TaxID=1353976 RepID=UPI0005AAF1E8|nr:hypothetical protein [Neochlamydia sp. S13]BBI18263.1 hypothetical protein NCS13_2_0066 [Neochlamydia sp. S13]